MDIGMRHTHTLVVTLYLLQLLVKTFLILTNKKDALAKFSKAMRIPHMVLTIPLVLTGGYLLYRTWSVVQPYMWIKIALVLASIPLGVVGVKRINKPIVLLSALCMGGAMFLGFAKPSIGGSQPAPTAENASSEAVEGASLFTANRCQTCHGEDGKLGFAKAKDLTATTLTDEEINGVIMNGKNTMPANPNLKPEEVKKIIAFIRSLKK